MDSNGVTVLSDAIVVGKNDTQRSSSDIDSLKAFITNEDPINVRVKEIELDPSIVASLKESLNFMKSEVSITDSVSESDIINHAGNLNYVIPAGFVVLHNDLVEVLTALKGSKGEASSSDSSAVSSGLSSILGGATNVLGDGIKTLVGSFTSAMVNPVMASVIAETLAVGLAGLAIGAGVGLASSGIAKVYDAKAKVKEQDVKLLIAASSKEELEKKFEEVGDNSVRNVDSDALARDVEIVNLQKETLKEMLTTFYDTMLQSIKSESSALLRYYEEYSDEFTSDVYHDRRLLGSLKESYLDSISTIIRNYTPEMGEKKNKDLDEDVNYVMDEATAKVIDSLYNVMSDIVKEEARALIESGLEDDNSLDTLLTKVTKSIGTIVKDYAKDFEPGDATYDGLTEALTTSTATLVTAVFGGITDTLTAQAGALTSYYNANKIDLDERNEDGTYSSGISLKELRKTQFNKLLTKVTNAVSTVVTDYTASIEDLSSDEVKQDMADTLNGVTKEIIEDLLDSMKAVLIAQGDVELAQERLRESKLEARTEAVESSNNGGGFLGWLKGIGNGIVDGVSNVIDLIDTNEFESLTKTVTQNVNSIMKSMSGASFNADTFIRDNDIQSLQDTFIKNVLVGYYDSVEEAIKTQFSTDGVSVSVDESSFSINTEVAATISETMKTDSENIVNAINELKGTMSTYLNYITNNIAAEAEVEVDSSVSSVTSDGLPSANY